MPCSLNCLFKQQTCGPTAIFTVVGTVWSCCRYVLGPSVAARCRFGKDLEPGLDFIDSKAVTRNWPAAVLASANRTARQPGCPVHDLARVVELATRMVLKVSLPSSAKMLSRIVPVLCKVYLQLSRDSRVVDLLSCGGPSPRVRGG